MKRPYVIINCAMSADGKIASPHRRQIRLSCEEDMKRMYELRNECDAVLVGIGTILTDDPKLTVKEAYVQQPKQPLRVILDSKGRTPAHALALNDTSKTLIMTSKGKKNVYSQAHIEVVECRNDTKGFIDLVDVLELLYKRGIRTLLVEGGGTVIWNFLKNRVVDDLFIYIAPCIIGGKDTPTVAEGEGVTDEERVSLKLCQVKELGPGVLLQYQLA